MFFRYFRWLVDREVDGPVWVVLGRSWGLFVRSWAALGAYVGGLGAVLRPTLAILSCSWASTGGPGPLSEASIGGLGCTWAALGAYVGDLGPLLGLYWRSCAALGAGAATCQEHGYFENVLIS